MNAVNAPLSDEEMDRLGDFLLDRIGDDEETTGKNGGVLDVSDLDGFLTAIVSGPVAISPGQWMPAVWGDFPPKWESEAEFKEILSLIFRHMNTIAETLMEQPQEFEPLFLEHTVEGETYDIVDEWCTGYMQGVALAGADWQKGGAVMDELLMPMFAFASEQSEELLKELDDEEIEAAQKSIAPNAREIHAYWLSRRAEFAPGPSPVKRATPRVGRNDPCPCGSGKKYKHCCLH